MSSSAYGLPTRMQKPLENHNGDNMVRLINVLYRLFGIIAGLFGVGCVLWAMVTPEGQAPYSAEERTLWFACGLACIFAATGFLSLKAWRPDLREESPRARTSWWTGEPMASDGP